MTQEKEKISELAEILALYAGVEYLAKQVGSWSTQVPPEQRYYHSEGRHRGPRGGRFSVIGTEVDQDGESLAQEGQSKSNQAEKVRDWVESNTEAQHVLDTLSQYGTPYVVGGGVRDALLGTPSKDVDIEVYGVSIDELSDIVKKDLGGKQDQVGKIFGVFKVGDFDISLPRTETKTGERHTDFDVEPNPNLSPELAAKRRDFTINALMYDHKNNEILDFFGGVQDLESKRIKHVSPETFVEDPLRVYRAAQFASRFDFSIDPSTQELARSMDLSEISNERVFGEFEKLLLKSSTPSTGIQALDDMGVLDTQFPEVATLKDTHQRSDHHAEGDVFTHTKMTLDKAAEIIQRFPDQKDKTIIMLAALCHDLGKPETTTSDGRAIGHEEAGVSITKEFLGKLTNDREILETVPSLVKDHLKPLQYHRDGASDAAFRRLINKHGTEYLNLLSAVSEADASGRLVKHSDGSVTGHGNEENVWFRDRIKQVSEAGGLKEGKIAPLITGEDLKGLGFKEGRELGDILRDVKGQQEEGEIASADEALDYVRNKYQSQQAEEIKKSDDLPELLTLLASVEHLFKQGESEWARFKDWTWDLAENKKHYHSDGRHTGSRGGTYDVIGYEVTAEGKPIGPGRVTGVAPPRGEVGLVGGEPSPSLQAKWENKPVSASQPNSLPQDINDLVTLDEYSKGLTEISKAELQQMVKDAYVQGRGTGALDSTPIQPNIAVFSEDDKGQKSLVGVSTGDGHWVAARLMDPANPLGGGKQDIMINRNVDGKVQATSIDKRGNKEAVYSWAWSANSERENHDKVGRLIESGAAEKIIKRMKSDIKNPKPVQGGPKGVEKTREAAAAAAVISLTGRRPGSPKQASEVSVAEKFRKSKLSNAQAAGAVKDAKGIPQSSKIVIKEDMLKLNKTPEGLVAKIDVRTFGVSTLQGRHVRDNGDGSVTLQFLGKAGKLNEVTVTDKEVAADLLSRKKKAGDKGQIFNISAGGVNDYIRSLTVKAAGKGATSKNLRTLNATMTARAIIKSESIPTVASIGDRQVSQVGVAEFEASVEYAEIKQVDKLKNAQRKAGAKEIGFLSSAERENFLRDWVQRQQDKKKLEIVGEPVADEIGNTPAIAIGEYVNPALFSEWDSYFQTEVEKLVSGPTLSPRKETSIRKRIKQIASKKRAKKGKRG